MRSPDKYRLRMILAGASIFEFAGSAIWRDPIELVVFRVRDTVSQQEVRWEQRLAAPRF